MNADRNKTNLLDCFAFASAFICVYLRLVPLRWGGDLSHVFIALGAALAAFGLINAVAVAGGAWFSAGRPATPRP